MDYSERYSQHKKFRELLYHSRSKEQASVALPDPILPIL